MDHDDPRAGLLVLATALAYVIDADNLVALEEKANMVTVFGKHVRTGHLGDKELRQLTLKAFEDAAYTPLEDFIAIQAEELTDAQKVSLVLNLLDTMFVDGRVTHGETAIIERIAQAFGIDPRALKTARQLMLIKNDTTVFTDPNHPRNEKGVAMPLMKSDD